MQPDRFGLSSNTGGIGGMGSFLQPNQHVEDSTEVEPQSTAIITCPKRMVGRVIGKNGETIKALQNFTGAQIQIDQRLDPTRVSIAGPPKALLTANNMVQDIVAGTFKGFAMLRAYANQTSRAANGFDIMAQQAPVYIKGYGFVPPSQFATDPADEFAALNGGQAYGDPFQQVAQLQNGPYATQVPTAMPNIYAQNIYAPAQAQNAQYQALALAHAQLMQHGQHGTPMRAQIPHLSGMQGGHGGMSQTAQLGMAQGPTSYALNPAAAYGIREDPNALAAQLQAMNIGHSQEMPEALSAPVNGLSTQTRNGNGAQGHPPSGDRRQ